MKDNFGDRLKYLLDKKGINGRQFAEILGVTDSAVNYYIKKQSYPKIENLIKISNLLNVSVDFLVGASDIEYIQDEHLKTISNNKKYFDLTKKIVTNEEYYNITKELFENDINLRIMKDLIGLNDRVKENIAEMLESLKN